MHHKWAHGCNRRVGRDEIRKGAIGELSEQRLTAVCCKGVFVLAGKGVEGDGVKVAGERNSTEVVEIEVWRLDGRVGNCMRKGEE